jgi:DNA processing protein
VGTRDASEYGERTAAALAGAAARAGLTVISGMARGIDAAAHRAALEAGGTTIAVQGTGVDVPYPAGHRALHREIAERGLVLSESEPGTRAFPGCFPRRNRLIAALARVTVVVEAPFKSGAINTAGQALDLGRVVAAVPGRIDDPRSAGSNQLIRDGAQVVGSVDDLLNLLGISTISAPTVRSAAGELGDRLVSRLAPLGMLVEDLAYSVGLPLGQVARAVGILELEGRVEVAGGLVRPADRLGPAWPSEDRGGWPPD